MENVTAYTTLFSVQVIASVFCGAVIGFERQLRGKPAGIRTSILICLGSQVFISLGMSLSEVVAADIARLMGQIITGIGFLGAGVIMAKENIVKGVTSAAVIWVLSGIGIAIGVGRLGTAFALTLVTVGVLMGVEFLEGSVRKLRRGEHASYHQDIE